MCRFLMVYSKKPIKPQKILKEFVKICKKSSAPNGDSQGDGWGVAWIDNKQKWKTRKSLSPIWQDKKKISSILETNVFAVHARSATFPKEKGIITYNQPFINDGYCFVFNGAINAVKLKNPIEGNIGSQKIWYLLRERLKEHSVPNALKYIKDLLEENSKEIIALNIGIATKESIYSLCKYNNDPEYYTLNYFSSSSLKIICSEKINGFLFKSMDNNEVISL